MATEAISPSSLHGADDLDRSRQWRALARTATAVAVLTSPVVFTWFYLHEQLDFRYALLLTVIEVAAFRGLVDLLFRRFIETPSLFGVESEALREADIVARRRVSFWRSIWKVVRFGVVVVTLLWLVLVFFGHGLTWVDTAQGLWDRLGNLFQPSSLGTLITLPLFFLFNFLIFMGPMLLMGISQIRGYQPGDAEWGVKLEHVRGQAEAKEEIRRIVTLWQSGERFEHSGGKRERGLLFLGAPGTGQDDARQGDRNRLQLALRDDPGLGLRPDVRRPRLDPRPLPGTQGEAARAQVGRAVHRLHRRDRRRRHAAERARRRMPLPARSSRSRRSSSRATSCSRHARGATSSSSCARRSAGSRTGSCSSSIRPFRAPAGCSAAVAAWR